MYVAQSRFIVRNEMSDQVRAAFRDRPHLVDDTPGFVRMEVLNPVDDPDEFWLLTWWTDEASFREWHKGHTFKASHKGIPKGLRLVPRESTLRGFVQVCT